MLNHKINKINNNYLNLRDNFNLLYFQWLINNSTFIIYFNYNKVSNNYLYNLKNEILKKKLKSFVINTKSIKGIFNGKFKYFSSNMLFIFCNNMLNFMFVIKLLNNIKFFYLFNKCFSNNNIIVNNSLYFLHFIIFKLTFNLLIILLYYILNFIKSIYNTI
jgi:hypothetical protein